MPFVSLTNLQLWRDAIATIEEDIGLHVDEETIQHALREIHRRLDGYIDVAKTREPQGLMNEEIAAHGLEIPDEHPTNHLVDPDTDDLGPF